MRKLTSHAASETLGVNFAAFVDNLMSEETRPVMEKYDIHNVNPHDWYPTQRLLAALNEIASQVNVTSNMIAIGMKIGEIVPLPPHMTSPTLPEVLMIWDDLYQALHRGPSSGEIKAERVSDTHYKTIHSVVYPDDMSYGILYAYGKRFLPRGTAFKVYYDPAQPARDYGGKGDTTAIHIEW
ncbi:MAG: hypothetical protein MUF38_19525 [Anaerolineae bacterium]|nr:hypothetical protein [Anaerolineae bacterium]